MSDHSSLKSDLRRRLRRLRRSLTPEQHARAADGIVTQCARLPPWADAQHIGVYQAADGEVDTTALAAAMRAGGKTPYLPVVEGKRLRFAQWRSDDALTANRFGIGEPHTGLARCDAQALDILCLPVVAWDRSGARLGMGGGYYDRTLEREPRPLLVGLAHSCQEIETLPRDAWDVALDWVVTESECLRCRRA